MIVQGYSLDFFRNLKDFKYPKLMSGSEKNEVKSILLSEITNLNWPFHFIPEYYIEKEKVDKFERANLHASRVINGETSVLIDESKNLIIKINEFDHFLMSAYTYEDPINLYKIISGVLSDFENSLKFQKDRNLGYLSSQVPLCGNGFMIDIIVHIPALMNTNKVMPIVQKAMVNPGTLLVPFSEMSFASAFFVVRCISKTDPIKDINFAKNIAEEISVMERAEVNELKQNPKFMNFISERVHEAKDKKLIQDMEFLRALDDLVLYNKLNNIEVKEEKIRDILINTELDTVEDKDISDDDAPKYFYNVLFGEDGGLYV